MEWVFAGIGIEDIVVSYECCGGMVGRTIRPVLSVGMAFYCLVFVEVFDDKAGVSDYVLCVDIVFANECVWLTFLL